MKSFKTILAVSLLVVFFSSCSHRLVGTWNVERYETVSPGSETVSLYNVGTMTFKKDYTGEKNLIFRLLGVEQNDQTPFTWTWNDDKLISINSEGSELSKTWIIVDNNRKKQIWKSTDGAENVQILELAK